MRLIPITLALAVLSATCSVRAADFEERVEAEADGTVEISNVAGSIRVAGWDRNAVEVHANLGDNVERVDVNRLGDHVTVRVVLKRRSWHDADAHLDIRVPRRSDLEISAISAGVSVANVQGMQRLKSVSGEVRTEAGTHELEVKTVSGNVSVRGNPKLEETRIDSISGDVRLIRGPGEIAVTTVSGRVDLELDRAESLRARTTSGRVDVRGTMQADGEIDAETVSGAFDFDVRMPKGLRYEVTTFSGDIRNCFDVEAVRTSKYGPGKRLQGTRGEGEAQLRVKTMSGSVDICDR